MKITSTLMAAALIAGSTSLAFAQTSGAAPGTPAPNTPRALPDGSKEPAPSQTVTGGVGKDAITQPSAAQTKSGGPVGGGTKGGSGG